MGKTNPFDERRENDPQGLIDDLLAQTTRQAREIHRLNKLVESLQQEKGEPESKPVKRVKRR